MCNKAASTSPLPKILPDEVTTKKLRRRKTIICDRYFYHMYGQYPYARNSRLMKILVKIFPNPDVIFLLTVPIEVLSSRRKDIERRNLERQKEQYLDLMNLKREVFALSNKNIDESIEYVLEHSWERMFDRLRY